MRIISKVPCLDPCNYVHFSSLSRNRELIARKTQPNYHLSFTKNRGDLKLWYQLSWIKQYTVSTQYIYVHCRISNRDFLNNRQINCRTKYQFSIVWSVNMFFLCSSTFRIHLFCCASTRPNTLWPEHYENRTHTASSSSRHFYKTKSNLLKEISGNNEWLVASIATVHKYITGSNWIILMFCFKISTDIHWRSMLLNVRDIKILCATVTWIPCSYVLMIAIVIIGSHRRSFEYTVTAKSTCWSRSENIFIQLKIKDIFQSHVHKSLVLLLQRNDFLKLKVQKLLQFKITKIRLKCQVLAQSTSYIANFPSGIAQFHINAIYSKFWYNLAKIQDLNSD